MSQATATEEDGARVENSASKSRKWRQRKAKRSKSAVELLEEACGLLRECDAGTWLCYYVGAVPFVGLLLYFWGEMTEGAYAEESLSSWALVMALAFVWLKCWQSVFSGRLLARLEGTQAAGATEKWGFQRVAWLIVSQTVLQSTSFFILPFSLLLMVFFAVPYGFYQAFTLENGRDGIGWGAALRRSWVVAISSPGQAINALSLLSLLFVIITLNVFLLIVMAPLALKQYLGVQTLWSLNIWTLFNQTFFFTAVGIAFLMFDPLAKAFFVVRAHAFYSLKTGSDLKGALRKLPGITPASLQAGRAKRVGRASGAVAIALLLIGQATLGVPFGYSSPAGGAEATVQAPAPTSTEPAGPERHHGFGKAAQHLHRRSAHAPGIWVARPKNPKKSLRARIAVDPFFESHLEAD